MLFVISLSSYNISDAIHRCRNRGGTDLTHCSSSQTFPGSPPTERDLICGDKKPLLRYCHIVALNGAGTHFSFTEYEYFTADSAHTTCEEVGGSVPSLKNQLDAIYLQTTMEYLLGFVSMGWPFSLKWISWPVIIKTLFNIKSNKETLFEMYVFKLLKCQFTL